MKFHKPGMEWLTPVSNIMLFEAVGLLSLKKPKADEVGLLFEVGL